MSAYSVPNTLTATYAEGQEFSLPPVQLFTTDSYPVELAGNVTVNIATDFSNEAQATLRPFAGVQELTC